MGWFSSSANGFGKKTTAKQIVDAFGHGQYLAGKTAVVTGGNSGIGLETVKALAFVGARVVLCSRSVEGGLKAVEDEVKKPGHGGYVVADTSNIIVKQLDLNSLKSVKALADDLNASEPRIDFLILNAGVMALPKVERTADGLEKQIGVNHFGHFYLYQQLEDKLKHQTFPSRVIAVSSRAHTMGNIDLSDINFDHGRLYGIWIAYGQSKVANILFAKQIVDRVKDDSQITAVSLHPGIINTNLGRHSWLARVYSLFMSDKSIPQGASTTLWACLSPDAGEAKNRGAYLDNCSISDCNAHGNDKELRVKFWDKSEEIVAAIVAKF